MELLNVNEILNAGMSTGKGSNDITMVHGHYDLVCTDETGQILWEDSIDNLVPTVGLNQLLASGVHDSLPGFLGLMSSGGTPLATDTMASHTGWTEEGGTNQPTYTGNRPTLNFGAISAGAINNSGTAAVFAMTGSGTVGGAFACVGSGASATKDTSTGVLLSAGTISPGQPVITGNTITMTYTLSLTSS